MQKLTEFDFETRRSNSKYDWRKLLDGSIWKLRHQKDYFGTAKSFMTMSYKKARERNCRLRIRLLDSNEIVMQSYPLADSQDENVEATDQVNPFENV